tara:strand:- start:960 stop:1196 length:237 start_codon:yes stop_codon:yes gene_type:complete
MMASRGMGDISPSKMPKGKKIDRKDDPNTVDMYAKGGPVGLYANINAKRKRGEKMRKPGQKGAPTEQAFIDSAKTAKK